jgi:tripartite-type tricarboxylate transporter receptor subunit TctC
MIRKATFHRHLLAAAALSIALPGAAMAANCPAGYPSEPIKMQVGYSAGGGTDTVSRQFAASLEELTGWTVVVENKPGATGGVMATGLMNMPGDGLHIGAGTSTTLAINPYKNPDTKYTYEDFKYVGSGMLLNYGLVATSDKPYKNLDEFIAFAKEKGRATVSTGSVAYEIAVNRIAKHYGVDLVPIPSRGSANALKDALGGHVDATVQGTAHVPQIRAGKMVQLATLTSQRASYAPDTKTLTESGLDLAIDGHVIFFLPKSTPDDIHTCLAELLNEAIGTDSYNALMTKLDTEAGNLGKDGTVTFLEQASAFYKEALAK